MSTDTSNTESIKTAIKNTWQGSNQAKPPALSALFGLLEQVEEALHEIGYTDAVLELRQGLPTDYGLRYTVYLRNLSATFETPLFSVFADGEECAFQAEGQVQSGLNVDSMIDTALDYLQRPHVVEYMKGLLHQFGRSGSAPALNTPSAA